MLAGSAPSREEIPVRKTPELQSDVFKLANVVAVLSLIADGTLTTTQPFISAEKPAAPPPAAGLILYSIKVYLLQWVAFLNCCTAGSIPFKARL